MAKKLTKDEFLIKVKKVNPNIIILDNYDGYRVPLKVKCKDCNSVFKARPRHLMSYSICPKCNNRFSKSKIDFKEAVKNLNPDIEILEDYIDNKQNIKFKCLKCGYISYKRTSHLLYSKHRCKNCEKNPKSMTEEEFLNRASKFSEFVDIIGKYDGLQKNILCKCKICGTEWLAKSSNIIRGKAGCPNKCKRILNTMENKLDRLNMFSNKFNFEYLGQLTYETKVKFICKDCGNIIIKPFREFYNDGIRCWNCNPVGSVKEQMFAEDIKNEINSYIERGIRIKLYKETEEYLKNKYNMIQDKYFSNNVKRYQLDIYFPNIKLGIEFDGNYWHSDDMKNKHYQVEKREFFKELGIKVIFIREDEWDFKREKILYRLMSILGLYKMKTYARKLYVDLEVPNFEANKLMELSHIQGKDNSSIKIGLRNKHETLVAVMTFGKPRYITKTKDDEETTYELIRYCTYPESVIVGGFSKLLKAGEEYLKTLGVTRIKTFADRRFSSDDDNVYLKNGFTLNNISGENYVYIRGSEVLKRYECQKHKLHKILGDNFDESLSETVNMANNGYLRIYDSGNLVYYKNIE